MSNASPLLIDCGPHGKRLSEVVCGHMVDAEDSSVGFVENSDDPSDLQAWCEDCEEFYLHKGDMTEAFRDFNRMALVCVCCFQELKDRHSRIFNT